MSSRFTRPASVAIALLVLTACGSTVQLSNVRSGGAGGSIASDGSIITGGDQSAAASAGGSGAGTGASGSGGSGSTSDASGAGTPSGSTTSPDGSSNPDSSAPGNGGGSNGSSTPTAASIPTSGKGWDAKNVYIGYVTTKDTAAIYGSLGANLDPGDTEGQANAVVKDINAHGGLYGRQVKIAFYDIKTLDTANNPDQTAQQVCTHFVEDRPVVAVYTQNTQLDVSTLHSCFAKAKIPLFSAGTPAKEDSELKSLSPYFISLAMASWDHVAPALASRLKAQDWMSGWNATTGAAGSAPVKIGILVDGTNAGARTAVALKKALADVGYPGAISFAFKQASDGQQASVNYFKGNKVTHVIVTNVELTAFQTSANNQQFRPRYGITSYNDPYTNLEGSGLTPAGQNNGAMGIGWAPSYDVSDSNAPTLSTGAANCQKVMTAGGQKFGGNKRIARGFAESTCDFFYLVVQSASSSNALDGTAIGAAAISLGSAFKPAIGFAAALQPGRLYVPGQARDLSWVSACKCFKYGAGSTSL